MFYYFVGSIFSTNKYKNFDFKLNANKGEQTCKFMSLLKNKSQEKSTTADKGVPYDGAIDFLINSSSVFGFIVYKASLEEKVVPACYLSFQSWYESKN